MKRMLAATLLALLGCGSAEEKPVKTIPVWGYNLDQYVDLPAKNSDKTAYYFFQTHYLPGGIGDDKTLTEISNCQLAIQWGLEYLTVNGKLDAIYFEGYSLKQTPEEFIRHAGFSIGDLYLRENGSALQNVSELREYHRECAQLPSPCLVYQMLGLYPTIQLRGFENMDSPEGKAVNECYNKAERIGRKLKERKERNPSITEREQLLKEGKEALYCNYQNWEHITKGRSREAYNNPFQDATSRGFTDYAVVIGDDHRPDILELAKQATVSPKIVRYSCPE